MAHPTDLAERLTDTYTVRVPDLTEDEQQTFSDSLGEEPTDEQIAAAKALLFGSSTYTASAFRALAEAWRAECGDDADQQVIMTTFRQMANIIARFDGATI